MKRVEKDQEWSLFSPDEAPGLHEVYGKAFETLYHKYEADGKARKTIKARTLWTEILKAQIETGTPYMVYKDAVNRKSNQKNIGVIKSSNLCAEIVEYTSKDEVAVCNLASISLPQFINKDKVFDFQMLHDIAYVATKNLNKVIDVTYYPIQEARKSNLRHRPIGLGVQGLADVFLLMRMPFDSGAAQALNVAIFETIYFAALKASNDLAWRHGPYTTFAGSPASKGILQFDMWGVEPSDRWDWKSLKKSIQAYGLRNSLLVAPMPTASTAQILGNNESIEPYTSNIYVRRVLSGEFIIYNKHLVKDLIKLGLWNKATKDALILANGSVQEIPNIPDNLKKLYRTVWEIPQRSIIDMAGKAGRGPFIDQSQSLNIHMENPTFGQLTSMHFYGWRCGLKTGMYYLRTKPAADAIKFTVDVSANTTTTNTTKNSVSNPPLDLMSTPEQDCLMCSS